MIRSLRENARGLVSDVLRDVMWPVLAVLVLSHLISVCVMLCLLRCGGAARCASRVPPCLKGSAPVVGPCCLRAGQHTPCNACNEAYAVESYLAQAM